MKITSMAEKISPIIPYSLPALIGAIAYNYVDTDGLEDVINNPLLYATYKGMKNWLLTSMVGISFGIDAYQNNKEIKINEKEKPSQIETRSIKAGIKKGLFFTYGLMALGSSLNAIERDFWRSEQQEQQQTKPVTQPQTNQFIDNQNIIEQDARPSVLHPDSTYMPTEWFDDGSRTQSTSNAPSL